MLIAAKLTSGDDLVIRMFRSVSTKHSANLGSVDVKIRTPVYTVCSQISIYSERALPKVYK